MNIATAQRSYENRLENEYQDAMDRQDTLSEMAEEIMRDFVLDGDTLQEALCESSLHELAAVMNDPNAKADEVVAALRDVVSDYWGYCARRKAERAYERGSL